MSKNKTAIITGATSGIGSVVVKHLVKTNYSVIILGRSLNKLKQLKEALLAINSNASIESVLCDLASFDSVKSACKEMKKMNLSIDLLVLNAGLWNFKFIETKDNVEETLQVNLLSQILLFNELVPHISKNGDSKVIFTSSGLHQGEINFEDIEFRKKFSSFKSYRQSKLAFLMFTRWLPTQTQYKGLSFYCVHPGMVNTQLGRSAGWLSRTIFQLFGRTKEKGAQTHIHLIDQNTKQLKSGEYYANSKVKATTKYSYDMNVAQKLWSRVNEYIK